MILKRPGFNVREWALNYEKTILFNRQLRKEIEALKEIEEKAYRTREGMEEDD